MAIEFSPITKGDLPAVKAIYDWYIAHSTATFHTAPIEESQLLEFIFIDHPLYKSYLAHDDGKLAGYCLLTRHKNRQAYDRTAEITIYLAPEHRSRGVGTACLQKLESVAQENGIKNLLGVITGDNEQSIALFERNGYKKCAHYKNIGEKFNKILDVVAYQKEI